MQLIHTEIIIYVLALNFFLAIEGYLLTLLVITDMWQVTNLYTEHTCSMYNFVTCCSSYNAKNKQSNAQEMKLVFQIKIFSNQHFLGHSWLKIMKHISFTDQKLLAKEIKDTHEAFLMAKKFYKKHLKIYYTIESRKGEKQTIFVQFFTEVKKETDAYSVKLLCDTKTGVCECKYLSRNVTFVQFNIEENHYLCCLSSSSFSCFVAAANCNLPSLIYLL